VNALIDFKEYFGELPQALVEQLVSSTKDLGRTVTDLLEVIGSLRESARYQLQKNGFLRRVDDLPPVQFPTTCGVDGAFGVEALIGCDLVAVTGVAVEGLTPPTEQRYWQEPHFSYFINTEAHRGQNRLYARALMTIFELEQAAKAPHDVVLLDGSFVTPISALHQALSQNETGLPAGEGSLMAEVRERASQAVRDYHLILSARRTDKVWLSMPKYTTRREIGRRLGLDQTFDDRALTTLLLKPGEFVGPVPLEQPTGSSWSGYYLTEKHLDAEARGLKGEIEWMLRETIQVAYFRVAPSNPALRMELPRAVAENPYRLATAFQAIRLQSSVPGLLEPQPLYYADRMAKSLSVAMPALRQGLAYEVIRNYTGDIDDAFLILHGYRAEEE